MSIFNRLKLAKTPKDLGQSIDEIDADIHTCQTEIQALERDRERVIFEEGESAVAKMQKELVSKRERLELLQIARRGAVDRQAHAESEQRQRETEDLAKQAEKETLTQLNAAMKEYHAAAVALVAAAEKATRLDTEISRINDILVHRGRSDLEISPGYYKATKAVRNEGILNGLLRLNPGWTVPERAEDVNELSDSALASAYPIYRAPTLKGVTIPGYCENGRPVWQQPYRFI